ALALEGFEGLGWIPYADFALNLRIFAWAFALALAFGVLSGVYPAWRMARLHPVHALRRRTAP
ncbi:MAG TPA: ABC transporter permease, partial [Thermoanaerobaculia bacterium]